MVRLLAFALVLLGTATGCGPTNSEITDAMTHRCEMERLAREMAADPSRTDLRDEYIERSHFLEMVISSSGGSERMRAILAERTCE